MLRVKLESNFFDQHFRWRGEYSLLQNGQDRYPTEDIFLHEFFHGLHNLGIDFSIPDFDDRLSKRYNYLKNSGDLWKNTYAMSTRGEYLAEGAQSFFDCNAESHPPNGIHNYVNTRSELKCYDSVLYGFLKEIFPCQNKFLERCDARADNSPSFFISLLLFSRSCSISSGMVYQRLIDKVHCSAFTRGKC